jgi:electron transfer flavoprotein beta subunit
VLQYSKKLQFWPRILVVTMPMKIVVVIKQIARLQDNFRLRSDGRDVEAGDIEYDLNESDASSLEEAVRIVERKGEGEVIVVSFGDKSVEGSIRRCLATGATRAIRVWSEKIDHTDPISVARVLAEALKPEQPNLIFAGVQSSDAAHSATGVALAEFLGLPHAAVIMKIDYHDNESSATVLRELEEGLLEEVRVRCPAILTIQTGINEPRYANLLKIKQAEKKPIEVVELKNLDVLPHARVRRMFLPQGKNPEILKGSVSDIAAKIAQVIREKMV